MYGLLSIDGNKLTDPIYEEIASVPYKEGVFLVKENEKYGVINNKGTELIKAEYDNIVGDGYYNDEEGYKASCFIVTKGEYMGYISEFGDTILENEYDSIHRITDLPERYIIAKRNGQFGLLNNTKIIIGFNYQLLDYDKSSNLIVVKRNKNYGVINIEGNKVLPLEYNDINIEGIYIVATKNGAIEKYTLDGQAVTNDLYSSIQKTNGEYYISIDKNYNYGIVDKDMNVIIPNKYEYMDYISDNLIIVRNSSGKYGVIDIKEQNKVSFDYDVMHTIKGTNIIEAMILSTKTLHLYNSDATRIYNEKNASIYEHDNYIEVSTDTSVSYFSNDAKELSNAEVYPNNTLLSYNENGKWGFKNREGEVVIQAIYDKVTELNANGFAGIMSDGKWGIINQTGEIISTPIYELPDNITSPDFLGKNYMGGLCYVALEG